MSTNNSLPFYPYFLFRFSPAYSKTAESPLFPSHVYAVLLSHSSSELRLFLPLFLVASIKAAVSKPIALCPSLSRARVRDFSRCTAFSLSLLLSIEQCLAIRNGRFSAAPQRQIQYLISIGKSDECYLYRQYRGRIVNAVLKRRTDSSCGTPLSAVSDSWRTVTTELVRFNLQDLKIFLLPR